MNASVFISYNHADIECAKAIEAFLTEHNMSVIRDEKDMLGGRSISHFIKESVRDNQFILFLVSKNSLSSGWVAMEIVETLWAIEFQQGKVLIPCYLDEEFLGDNLMDELVNSIDNGLKSHEERRSKLVKKKLETKPSDEQIKRLTHLRNNLPKIIAHLQTHKTVNISPPNFEAGMAEVLKAIGQSSSPEILLAYANWLVRRHSTIPVAGLGGATEIELNKVFVSLRGELSNDEEVSYAHERFLEAVKVIEHDFSLSPLEKQRQKSRSLGRSAIMPSIQERDMVGQGGHLNLAEAFERFDRLVILGDPGMGKTTLARWLVLKFAEALSEGESKVCVFADQISAGFGRGERIDLGSTRLPILIRVGEMAAQLKGEAKFEDILGFLGEQTWLGYRPSHDEAGQKPIEATILRKLMSDHLYKGEALLIFDGLDEISEERSRQNAVNAIVSFFTEIERKAILASPSKRNKFIVTSRIAGYHTCPLKYQNLKLVTIQPMEDPAIADFCRTWVKAAHYKATTSGKRLEIEFSAHEITQGLIKAIFAPTRSGVRILAGNPLMLTELGKIYYKDRKFPDTRADLYDTAARNMLDPWRARARMPLEEHALFEHKVFFVFADIAERIHEEYPAGLIAKDEIIHLIGESLANFYRENPGIAQKSTSESEKKSFLKTLNEEVGILAARGAEYYGFLHLTFEEFFAAKKLLRYPEQTAKAILDKAYHPRWREPLLLALGHMQKSHSEKTRHEVLLRLVQMPDPMGDLVPRSAGLIAQALPEMGFKPGGELMETIILQLLGAYAGAGEFKDGEVLRTSIDDSVKPLLKVGFLRNNLEQTLLKVLQDEKYKADLKNSAALLLLRNGISSEPLARALLAVRSQDDAAWKWPIHLALMQNGHSQPEWLDFRLLLPFRVYLKDHPNTKNFIERNPAWLQIIVLLYGGMVARNSKPEITYEFSHTGIFRDSCLTEPIIELLESDASPELLIARCKTVWQDERLPILDRADALLCFLLLQNSIAPSISALALEASPSLLTAVTTRLDLVSNLLDPAIGAMIQKANLTLGGIISGMGQEDNVRQLMFRMLQLPLAFKRNMVSDPISWLYAVPVELQPTILAEYWVRGFFSEDAAYSFAVMLDTAGGRIEKLGPEVIARSFAVANQATNLPPFEKWRLERGPFEPKDLDDILDAALLHLAALTPEFNMLKYWAFDQILPLLKSRPNLPDKVLYLLKSMDNSTYFPDFEKLIFSETEVRTKVSDEDLEKNVESDFSKAAHYILIKPGNKKLHLKILASRRKLDKAHHALRVLSTYRTQGFSFARDNQKEGTSLWELFDHTVGMVTKLRTPEARILGYLKLASFWMKTEPFAWADFFRFKWVSAFLRRKRTSHWLVSAAIETADKIKDQYILAQSLREIQTWTTDDTSFQKRVARLCSRLTNVNARAVLEDRYSPAFFTLGNNIEMHFALTALGACLRDMNMVFGLPPTAEALWEQLHTRPLQQIDTVVERLCELGRFTPLRLTLLATLSLVRLIKHDRIDLLTRLMTCVGNPAPETVPIISAWLDSEHPPLQGFAALLLLEAGILTTKSFPHLELVLFNNVMGRQDQFRNRANYALNPNDRLFFASKIGAECLEMVEHAQETYEETSPYLVRALSWIDEYLVYDDPDIIQNFIKLAKTAGRRADTATHFLRGIQLLTPESFDAYMEGLRDLHPRVNCALLRSVIFVLHHNSLRFEEQDDLLEVLRTEIAKAAQADDLIIRKYALDAIGYLPTLSEEERQILTRQTSEDDPQTQALALIALGRADFEQSRPVIESFRQHELPELRRAAAECICRKLVPTIELLQPAGSEAYLNNIEEKLKLPNEEVLWALLSADRHNWWDNYSKNCTTLLSTFFERNAGLFVAFITEAMSKVGIKRSTRRLHNYEQDNEWQTRMAYLDALAAGATKLPEAFRKAVEQIPGCDTIFCRIVLESGTFTDRRNALICLSCMRNMTKDASVAFCAAMNDIAEVQTAAIKSIWRFEETEPHFIRNISEMMDKESLGSCYAMVGMLKSIGTHPKTETAIRQEIMEVLKSKLEMGIFRDHVYVFEKRVSKFTKSDGTEQETEEGTNLIRHCGRLDHEIYRAILDVAGIRAKK